MYMCMHVCALYDCIVILGGGPLVRFVMHVCGVCVCVCVLMQKTHPHAHKFYTNRHGFQGADGLPPVWTQRRLNAAIELDACCSRDRQGDGSVRFITVKLVWMYVCMFVCLFIYM